jgi:hypothetical protein
MMNRCRVNNARLAAVGWSGVQRSEAAALGVMSGCVTITINENAGEVTRC